MPTPQTPPPSVPVQVVPVETSTNTMNTQNGSNSDSKSKSESDSSQNNSQQNINVNNNTSVASWGTGISRPLTTLNLSAFTDRDGGVGSVVTISIPLGGRSHKNFTNKIEDEVALRSEIQLASACANIAAAGINIDPSSERFKFLKDCKDLVAVIKPEVPVVPPPTISSDIDALKAEMAEYKKMIADQQLVIMQLHQKIGKQEVPATW